MTTALARYRRLPPQEPTLRLIAFPLRAHWFCLPLAMARRVIPPAPDDPTRRLGLTQLHHEQVPLLDVAERVYQTMPLLPGYSDPEGGEDSLAHQVILVVETSRMGLLGLLIDDIPCLKRARQSAFSPVPATYLTLHRLQGIHTLVNQGASEPPLFLLDVDALVF